MQAVTTPPMNSSPAPVLPAVSPSATEPLATLCAAAGALQAAQRAGTLRPSLKGRIFAVLSAAEEEDDRVDVAMIDHAAAELGARVAHIRPHLTERSDPHTVELTAQMLGRLYTAVLCLDIAPDLMERLSAVAGIPILGGFDDPAHPVSRVAAMLGDGAEARKFALQALLLRSVA